MNASWTWWTCQFRQSFTKETFSWDGYLKVYNIQYWKSEMRERKKTGVHGTLELTPLAWNSILRNFYLRHLILGWIL